jgi:hypothetical protein
MKLALHLGILCLPLTAQITVSMNLMSSAGTAPLLGKGLSAYAWNLRVCAIGPTPIPIPWALVESNFPEVNFYTFSQSTAILNARVDHSFAYRATQVLGYGGAAIGLGVTIENTLHKSPSELGPIITAGGLLIPAAQALFSKNIPKYAIDNPPPAIIALGAGQCADYTALAAFGKAPASIPMRRIDPLVNQPATLPVVPKQDWEAWITPPANQWEVRP